MGAFGRFLRTDAPAGLQTIWIDLVRSRDVRKEEGDMPEDHRCRTG
jgi:hypothetical protein